MGIVTSTQARINSVLLTLFFIMWVKKFYADVNEGYVRGNIISGIANVVGMVSAFLFGFVYESSKMTNV